MYVIDIMTLAIPLLLLVLSPIIYFAAKSAFTEIKTPIKQDKVLDSKFTVNFSSSVISQASSLLETITIAETPRVVAVTDASATKSRVTGAAARRLRVAGATVTNSRLAEARRSRLAEMRGSRVAGIRGSRVAATISKVDPVARNRYKVIYGGKQIQIVEPTESYDVFPKIISVELSPQRKTNLHSVVDKKAKYSSF